MSATGQGRRRFEAAARAASWSPDTQVEGCAGPVFWSKETRIKASVRQVNGGGQRSRLLERGRAYSQTTYSCARGDGALGATLQGQGQSWCKAQSFPIFTRAEGTLSVCSLRCDGETRSPLLSARGGIVEQRAERV